MDTTNKLLELLEKQSDIENEIYAILNPIIERRNEIFKGEKGFLSEEKQWHYGDIWRVDEGIKISWVIENYRWGDVSGEYVIPWVMLNPEKRDSAIVELLEQQNEISAGTKTLAQTN